MKYWQLTLDGHSLTGDDMTLEECELVETITGTDWSRLNPVLSAKHARAVAQVVFARIDPEKAEERARHLTLAELMDGYQLIEDDLPTEFVDGIPPMGGGGATVG